MTRFDFIVIGGGSGGMASARRAASHGAKVLLIEGARLGGTCVNVGCVPKKVMWNAAQLADYFKVAASYGFATTGAALDWPTLKARRDAYVARLNGIYARNLDKSGVTFAKGWAAFVDRQTIAVGSETYTAPAILVACGGRPLVPAIPGHELGATSDDFFTWQSRPDKVTIVGAGYIGIELAGVLNALGTKVCLVVRGECILRAFDQGIAAALLTSMIADGIDVKLNCQPTKITKVAAGIEISLSTGESIATEKLIWTIGREPRIAGLDLQKAGIQTKPSGHIVVDDNEATTATGVYAVGDVTGKKDLTPVAIAAGRRLADRLFAGGTRLMNYEAIPSVVFSHPPVASVGMSAAEAEAAYGAAAIKVFESRFVNMFYAPGDHKPTTLMRLVVRLADDRVLGAHVMGMGADEMMQGFAVAINMGATKADFDQTVAIHPVAAEEFVTMT